MERPVIQDDEPVGSEVNQLYPVDLNKAEEAVRRAAQEQLPPQEEDKIKASEVTEKSDQDKSLPIFRT